jgi:hypothetical protein
VDAGALEMCHEPSLPILECMSSQTTANVRIREPDSAPSLFLGLRALIFLYLHQCNTMLLYCLHCYCAILSILPIYNEFLGLIAMPCGRPCRLPCEALVADPADEPLPSKADLP